MSKIKLLFDVVSNLHSLAESIEAVASIMESANMEANAEPKKKSEKVKKKKDTAQKEKEYTLVEVREILSAKSAGGYGDSIRELLKKYGQTKLSEIDPEDYPALLADAALLPDEEDE